jgi:glycosyltransferase involved in cell wall biosynthesis
MLSVATIHPLSDAPKNLRIMTQNQPLVSIGLPIYNAEQSLRRALDTLLAQDYPNIQLIISDNASTDDTWAICQQYEAQDSRIRLYRSPTNIGANGNFERVFSLATGEFFMWAAHDDWWEPTFVSQCMVRLEAVPNSVLCHVAHEEIDENGHGTVVPYAVDLENEDTWTRVYSLLSAWPMPNVYIYGLFRREVLNQTMPMVKILASDTILLLKVLQLGLIVGVNEPLHHYSIGRQGRGLRAYIQSLAPNSGLLRAVSWEWRLFFIFWGLSQQGAPSFGARLRGIWAAGRLVHRYTGWPLSVKMFLNYAYILMPDSLANGLRRWVDTHPRVERLIMRLVKNRKAAG